MLAPIRVRILIVDDEADLAQVLAEFLERLGDDTLMALSVRRAIDSANQNLPDLVITDLRLPDGDGFDVIRHVRQILPQTPLILMTAYHDPGMQQTAQQAGAAAYLPEPFALAALALHSDPDRLDEVNHEITDFGCQVVAQYAVLGAYDFVTIIEGPDNETMAHLSVDLGSRGTVNITTLSAIPLPQLRTKLKGPKQIGRKART